MRYNIQILAVIAAVFFNTLNATKAQEIDSLNAISVTAPRIYQANAISLKSNDFKKLAASFDDPTRLLMKYSGFATVNDQANGLIYRGMPSHFSSWQMNGAEIVNPNHLSNAGTAQDNVTQNSGGVNAVNGQVLESMTFQNSLSKGYHSPFFAGIMNLQPGADQQSYIQAGLLGFEGQGTYHRDSSLMVYANGRYSFTGALAKLGVNFGGESIYFQDISGGFRYYKHKNELKGHITWGSSQNHFNQEVNKVETLKDFFDIDYRSNLLLTSLQWINADIGHGRLSTTVNYSTRQDQRNSFQRFESVVPLPHYPDYNRVNSFLAVHTNYQSNDWQIGIKYNQQLLNNEVSDSVNALNWSMAYASYNARIFKNFEINALAYYHLEVGQWGPQVSFKWQKNQAYVSLTGAKHIQYVPLIFPTDLFFDPMQSESFGLDIGYQTKTANYVVQLFNYYFEDMPWFYNGNSLINNDFISLKSKNIQAGSGSAYGLSVNIDKVFANGWWTNVNAASFRSWIINSVVASDNDLGYTANVQCAKSILRKNSTWTIASAFHLQGGGPIYPFIDANQSLEKYYLIADIDKRFKPYWRIDLRLQYLRGKNTFSLDIQNLTGRENDGFYVHDFTGPTLQKQLGMIPVFSYKRFLGR